MAEMTRRALLGITGGLAAAGLAGCGRNSGAPTSGTTTLQFGWWGNELRNAQTSQAIAAYLEDHSELAIDPLPAEFSAYWERLATQTAANDAPDVIQMADGFIGDYGSKGALLDLADLVDTSKFGPGTLDSGRVDGKLVGINAGINTPVIMANPKVLERAGVELPDDQTWTWDDYRDLAAEVTANSPKGTFGTASPFSDKTMQAWLRQHGADLFTADGQLAFTAADLEPYFALLQSYVDAKALPPAEMITEEEGRSLEQSSLAEGRTGFAIFWSNQLAAISKAAGGEVAMLRLPSVTGKAADLRAWYHPSMLWSASSRTEHPDQVGQLIGWWVNSVDCASICLDERGYPANTEIAAAIESKLTPEGRRVAEFIAELEPALGDTPPAPPPGGGTILGDVLGRAHADVLFGKITGKAAAERFAAESQAALA
ncbi:ABC transporter substrate-binding protein [Microlunatus speluncae]|uniref:ABC transporter substrate-binding protein n=1 Tax=Microlunatus speluncae TaxID=2594267 RepID=UPI0012664987|nr:extracellular solute-binding protein [Microlunatus speluncae]